MRGFKKFSKALPCRECVYRQKSLAKQIQGSFVSQSDEAYFMAIAGNLIDAKIEWHKKKIEELKNKLNWHRYEIERLRKPVG